MASERETLRLSVAGLNCAACSMKIERALAGLPGVVEATVDMAGGRISLSLMRRGSAADIVESVREVMASIEPGAAVLDGGVPKEPSGLPMGDAARLAIGGVLWLAAIFLPLGEEARISLYVCAYLVAGIKVLAAVARNLRGGSVFDEFFLMTAATLGAFALGDFSEAVAVMLFYESGELVQDLAVERSRKSIMALADIRPDTANILDGGVWRVASAASVVPGRIVLVKPGERVPLDGRVREGSSSLDTSSLTGESVPLDVSAGAEVLAGSVNLGGAITVDVTSRYGDTALSKGLRLIEEAREGKAPTERFITAFARWYTPAVVGFAVLLAIAPPLAGLGDFRTWVYRALVFLVVSCPCALVISIPLAVFGGIGAASRRGILVKGGDVLERLADVRAALFDKTGTLTRGVFRVTEVHPSAPFTARELIEIAAAAERGSNHPIARAVANAAGPGEGPQGLIEELPGLGVRLLLDGVEILAGNASLLERYGASVESSWKDKPGAVVHVARGGAYAGFIVVEDTPREQANTTVNRLRELGVRFVGMLSGDRPENAEKLARELGLDLWRGGLMPADKLEHFRRIKEEVGGTTIFVGDGMNDAPLLAASDAGFAMGGLGADAAIGAADVVLLDDDPSGAAEAIEIARRTRAVMRQNIAFALGVKGLVLAMGAFGAASMWEAVFADVGVALLATLNSARILSLVGAPEAL
ncbi:MAG: heavy metal translocating P-type ATPase [Synergistota bacterium]|jgi:Cd2+/Zn2+-exporting ATPase|nr:heavy metal translocating P-type ATPase [Synergistota bacterium]